MTDSDDDYCVSYTVTMVDVRSCTRTPRLMDQQHTRSEHSNMFILPRSPDQTHVSKYPDMSRQPRSLCPTSTTSIGEFTIIIIYHINAYNYEVHTYTMYICMHVHLK